MLTAGGAIVFEEASQMNAYVEKNGITGHNYVAMDNMEKVSGSGIQCGGESVPPRAGFGSSSCEERAQFVKARCPQ